MYLLSRVALGLLGLSFGSSVACQMDNPAFDLGGAAETRGTGDGDPATGDGDGDTLAGDGDGDGEPTTGDGDGDPTTGDGDGDPTTGDGDGDPTTGDGDGDIPMCGNGVTDPGEECDDGNLIDGDGCSSFCTLPDPPGDGDGDGDMQMCQQIVDPIACGDCLNGSCCSAEGLACANSFPCKCMLACLDTFSEMVCAGQCDADPNTAALAVDTFPCAEAHCPDQCTEG